MLTGLVGHGFLSGRVVALRSSITGRTLLHVTATTAQSLSPVPWMWRSPVLHVKVIVFSVKYTSSVNVITGCLLPTYHLEQPLPGLRGISRRHARGHQANSSQQHSSRLCVVELSCFLPTSCLFLFTIQWFCSFISKNKPWPDDATRCLGGCLVLHRQLSQWQWKQQPVWRKQMCQSPACCLPALLPGQRLCSRTGGCVPV